MKAKHARQTHAKLAKAHRAPSRAAHAVRHNGNGSRHAKPSNGNRAKTTPMVNGVNVNDMVLAIESIKNDPALAEYSFRAKTNWVSGGHARTKIQGFWGSGREDNSRPRAFTWETDEPPMILGANHGPSAYEVALSGLGACLAVGVAYNAAARGIKIDSLDVELEGGLDLRGFLGIREGAKGGAEGKAVRPGFEHVRVVCRVKSEAPPSELKELLEYVEKTSPVMDLFRTPVPVSLELQH